jgi:hypothetical protein
LRIWGFGLDRRCLDRFCWLCGLGRSKKIVSQKKSCSECEITYFSTTGSGAFFGAGGGGANMLAQLFLTPTGIMLEAA